MEELVFKSNDGNNVTSSRIVASKFEKRHSDVVRAIENLECSDDFLKRNFALLISNNIGHPSPLINQYKEYNMTRDGFMFLAMGFTGEKAARLKEGFIDAFNSMEKAITSLSLPDFTNPVEAARAWADQLEKRQLAEKQVSELKPKADVTDMIANATGLLSWNDAAKSLGTGRNRLTEMLRKRGILFGEKPVPYQKFIEAGYFKVKISPITKGSVSVNYTQTFVTAKGLTWLANGILKTINQ